MKSYITSIFLLCVIQLSHAQKHPWEVRFSYQIEQQIADNKLKPVRAATIYSIIGDYKNSTQLSELPISWGVDSFDYHSYHVAEALPRIVDLAMQHRIVIISENHQKPQHRIFASQIIGALAEHGFRHLGMETLSVDGEEDMMLDSRINERGYPLNSPMTGTYTLEPTMGNLVREAIKHDYNLFGYERAGRSKNKEREEAQADNIIRYLNNNPNAKIIIHCGFHHAIESDWLKRGKSYWMAKILKDKTGIDPLTIYQDNFTEKFIENEHPFFANAEKSAIDQPSVFVTETGEIARVSSHVDIEVIHPKTRYIDGRPHWLYQNNKRSVPVRNRDYELSYPIIVSAYPIHEANSVPVDCIEIKHRIIKKTLVLQPGTYKVTLFDGENTVDYEEIVE